MKHYILISISLLLLTGCKTTRQVKVQREEKVTEMAQIQQSQTTKLGSSITDFNCIEEETITETVDTVIRVFPVVDGKASLPIDIPVKLMITTFRKTVSTEKQCKSGLEIASSKNESLQIIKEKKEQTQKQKSRTLVPGILVLLMLVVIIAVGVIVWKRFSP